MIVVVDSEGNLFFYNELDKTFMAVLAVAKSLDFRFDYMFKL